MGKDTKKKLGAGTLGLSNYRKDGDDPVPPPTPTPPPTTPTPTPTPPSTSSNTNTVSQEEARQRMLERFEDLKAAVQNSWDLYDDDVITLNNSLGEIVDLGINAPIIEAMNDIVSGILSNENISGNYEAVITDLQAKIDLIGG